MIYVFNKVKTDKDAGTWGDCVAACIHSLTEIEPPHFFHDGCDGDTGHMRIAEWLDSHGLAPIYFAFQTDEITDVLEVMSHSPDAPYILFGETRIGPHAVVCRGGSVEHDPAWLHNSITGPTDAGQFVIMAIVSK